MSIFRVIRKSVFMFLKYYCGKKKYFFCFYFRYIFSAQNMCGFFPTKNIQTFSPLRSGHLYMNDAQCAETNEKQTIFSFWVIGRQRYQHSAYIVRLCGTSTTKRFRGASASLHHKGPIECRLECPRTAQQYCTEGFERSLDSGLNPEQEKVWLQVQKKIFNLLFKCYFLLLFS